MFKCKYCNREFNTKQQLAGHVSHCSLNPNYENNMNILEKARKYKKLYDKSSIIFNCPFCGKEVGNKGCLELHKRRCEKNPEYKPTKLQLEKSERKNKPKKLSEEHKQHIREGLSRWRKENEEIFLQYSRGKSKCCENFKNMLKENKIDFIEEYSPFIPERLYSLDIAFPDIKIGIEINGSQHYNSDGELNEKTLEKQKFFEERGWKLFQIYYKDCYSIDIKNFSDILILSPRNKQYIKSDFDIREKIRKEKEKVIQDKILKKIEKEECNKKYIELLINNSGIDFSKSGWSRKAQEYIKKYNPEWNSGVFRIIRRYCPEFLKQDNVWKRKGSIF